MPVDLQPLPVAVEASDEESGLGFLLRCAHANGIALQFLANHAGVRSLRWMVPRDIETLAYLAGVSPNWLGQRVKTRRQVNGRRQYSYLGWEWGSIASLRVKQPQVCPECLAEYAICRAEWDVAMIFACPVHRALLIDRCSHCGMRLTWLRPAIDVCCCGRYLRRSGREHHLSRDEMPWCQTLSARLEGKHLARAVELPTIQLPEWIFHVTPDGASRLVHALGALSKPGQCLSSAKVVEIPSPFELAEVIERGLARGRMLLEQSIEFRRSMRVLIYEPGLQRLARQGVVFEDQQAAAQLMKSLDCESQDLVERERRRGGRPTKGQLELFQDAGA